MTLAVAIAGGGISGLAAAIALARQGARVALYESFAAPAPRGSGLMLQPTGLCAMQRLGLREEIEALGEPIARVHGATDRGRTVFDIAYAALGPGLGGLGVHRAALHAVLWRAFLACGARLAAGAAVADLAHEGARAIPLLADGRRGEAADLFIDASGARSQLRRHVTGATARPFAYGAVWATVPDIGLAPRTLAQRYIGAHTMVGYLPVGHAPGAAGRSAALFWSLKPAHHAHWAARFEAWRAEAVRLWPGLAPVVAGLRGPGDLTLAQYTQFSCATPWRGNVALIGDAAHCTSPQLGQGANNGLLDALALADALAAAGSVAAALPLYAARRRAHVAFYQRASRLLTPAFQSDSRIMALARDHGLHRLSHVPWLRREMVRTLAGLKTGLLRAATPERLAGMG